MSARQETVRPAAKRTSRAPNRADKSPALPSHYGPAARRCKAFCTGPNLGAPLPTRAHGASTTVRPRLGREAAVSTTQEANQSRFWTAAAVKMRTRIPPRYSLVDELAQKASYHSRGVAPETAASRQHFSRGARPAHGLWKRLSGAAVQPVEGQDLLNIQPDAVGCACVYTWLTLRLLADRHAAHDWHSLGCRLKTASGRPPFVWRAQWARRSWKTF